MKPYASALVWLRRDLRATDHHALCLALQQAHKVWVLFVFDTDILQHLPAQDRRISFIEEALRELRDQHIPHLMVQQGKAVDVVPQIAKTLGVQAVFCNDDVEPAAKTRDARVRGALAGIGIAFIACKDHYVFGAQEVLTRLQQPYSVFTPYKNAWLQRLRDVGPAAVPDYDPHVLAAADATPLEAAAPHPALAALPTQGGGLAVWPSLASMGFASVDWQALHMPTGSSGARNLLVDFLERIAHYDKARDYPGVRGPSYLSVHLRFGTISIRQLVRAALQAQALGLAGASVWLSELIWRDFYIALLAHYPHVVDSPFKASYQKIVWEKGKVAKAHFAAWSEARTGYPLVDAAMQQLLQSGYMHNRLRMVSASFLCKHLGVDYRQGEAFFALHLNDFDLAANNGGWQWAASTGCDAQPWFRIFNPITQSEKFDPTGKFIRRYLPQLAGLPDKLIHTPWLAPEATLKAAGLTLVDAGGAAQGAHYPRPIVDHQTARAACLARYSVVKSSPDK